MNYNTLISVENIFSAWEEFVRGKRQKNDVQFFGRHLEDNLFKLHEDLKNKTYHHGPYKSFYVHDPKHRHIHKASVRDRVVHHLLYTYLYNLFDKTFIHDSYSCRLNKGTHKAVDRLETFTRKVSRNYTNGCWVLHCDVKKFFASVDHRILKYLLERKIKDKDILWLLSEVIDSFETARDPTRLAKAPAERVSRFVPSRMTDTLPFWRPAKSGTIESPCGIPLGNVTSQVFANIYLNQLDQYVKHQWKIKYYIRYADDFVIVSKDRSLLDKYIQSSKRFLQDNLRLSFHDKKITIRKLDWGIDFLGYIILPHYRLPRTATKRRIFTKLRNKISDAEFNQSLQSYLGFLSHADSYQLSQELQNRVWFWSG